MSGNSFVGLIQLLIGRRWKLPLFPAPNQHEDFSPRNPPPHPAHQRGEPKEYGEHPFSPLSFDFKSLAVSKS